MTETPLDRSLNDLGDALAEIATEPGYFGYGSGDNLAARAAVEGAYRILSQGAVWFPSRASQAARAHIWTFVFSRIGDSARADEATESVMETLMAWFRGDPSAGPRLLGEVDAGEIPDTAGFYTFRSTDGECLYVGSTASLQRGLHNHIRVQPASWFRTTSFLVEWVRRGEWDSIADLNRSIREWAAGNVTVEWVATDGKAEAKALEQDALA
jgi:hypothetical protein